MPASYAAVTFLYHADAEVDRAQNIATAIALVILAVIAYRLVSTAPRDRPPGWATRAALAIGILGIGGFLATRVIPDTGAWETGWRLNVAWALFAIQIGAVFLAIPVAVAARARKEGRLAGVAVVLSLVLPVLFVSGMVGCAVTDGCFH